MALDRLTAYGSLAASSDVHGGSGSASAVRPVSYISFDSQVPHTDKPPLDDSLGHAPPFDGGAQDFLFYRCL